MPHNPDIIFPIAKSRQFQFLTIIIIPIIIIFLIRMILKPLISAIANSNIPTRLGIITRIRITISISIAHIIYLLPGTFLRILSWAFYNIINEDILFVYFPMFEGSLFHYFVIN